MWAAAIIIVTVAATAAEPSAAPALPGTAPAPAALKTRTAAELKEAHRQAAAADRSTQAQQKAAVTALIGILDETERNTSLPPQVREQLNTKVRASLKKISAELQRNILREKKSIALAERAAAANARRAGVNGKAAGILAQRQQPGRQPGARQGGQNGGAAGGADLGQDLVDLIQTTIAPQSWDVNGGPGSIMYFRNLQVLVVRNRGEVHGDLGGALQQLRR